MANFNITKHPACIDKKSQCNMGQSLDEVRRALISFSDQFKALACKNSVISGCQRRLAWESTDENSILCQEHIFFPQRHRLRSVQSVSVIAVKVLRERPAYKRKTFILLTCWLLGGSTNLEWQRICSTKMHQEGH